MLQTKSAALRWSALYLLGVCLFTAQTAKAQVRIPFTWLPMPAEHVAVIRLVIDAGSVRDLHYHGLAALSAQTQMATQKMQATEKKIRLMGGALNLNITRDATYWTLTMPAKQQTIDEAVTSFARAFASAKPDAQALAAAKNAMKADAETLKEKPLAWAKEGLFHVIFGKTPYGHAVWGDASSLSALTLKQVMLFQKRYNKRALGFVVVAGPSGKQGFTRDDAFRWTQSLWSALAPEALDELREDAIQTLPAGTLIEQPSTNKTTLQMSGIVPLGRGTKNRATYQHIAHWLADKTSGPFATLLTDPHAGVYAVDAGFDALTRVAGVLWWSLRSDPEHLHTAQKKMSAIIKSLGQEHGTKKNPTSAFLTYHAWLEAQKKAGLASAETDLTSQINRATQARLDELEDWRLKALGKPVISAKPTHQVHPLHCAGFLKALQTAITVRFVPKAGCNA